MSAYIEGIYIHRFITAFKPSHRPQCALFTPPNCAYTLSCISLETTVIPGAGEISLQSKRFHLVSEQGKTGFGRARNETRAKKWKRGKGEGKEGNSCRQTPRFRQRTQRLIGSAIRTILSCVDQRFGFILRGHLWYLTGTLWLFFSLVGKIFSPPLETQSASCD